MPNLFFTMLATYSLNLLSSSIAPSWDFLATDKSTLFIRGVFLGTPIIWPDGVVILTMGGCLTGVGSDNEVVLDKKDKNQSACHA
jgi:hypothetical protein